MKLLATLVVFLPLALAIASCAGAPPLDPEARAVAVDASDVLWRPGVAEDVAGLYSSTDIEGAAAAVLIEVHYRFAADGSFTGAALVNTPSFAYQVLTGRWRVADGFLSLSEDGEPARLEAREDLLRLSSSEGTVILRRRSSP